jgi:hypothetical protein
MNNLSYLIEKYKYGIIAVLATYIGIFMYMQLETYNQVFVIKGFGEQAELIQPDEIQINPENIEIQNQNNPNSEVKNLITDANDTREKSNKDYSETKASNKDVVKSVKEFEAQLFREAEGNKTREKILKEHEETLKKQKEATSKNQKDSKNLSGSDKVYEGKTMVSWSLKNRTPHENNAWYVRNPGYTCGSNASGEVTIRIKVNQSGNVISAQLAPELSSSSNACMIEQAKKYAMMSRFNYSAAQNLQEGTITYTFISQ